MKEFKDVEGLEAQLKNDLGRALLSVQTARVVDAPLFEQIDVEARALARFLKPQALVSKSLLNQLRVASKILRAEAPYVEGGRDFLIAMADKFETTLDLILSGECHDDLVPGVPRII